MAIVRLKPNEGATGSAGAASPAPGRLLRRFGYATAAVCLATPVLLVIGFFWFIAGLPAEALVPARSADGIVVLTGGASRISDAIELLAAGHGRRLLISGANRSTNADEISRLNPEFTPWVRCCVDFDRSLNTLGNAVQTRLWAQRRGFRSLIVVTSSYHMPRAMAELAHQLPGADLVPHPVVSDRLRMEPWWASGSIAKLLFTEYLKYMVARVRIRLQPGYGIGEPA